MNYYLKNNRLELVIDSFGAQITSVKLDGIEKLWQNDNGSWEGHAPLLFPVCGHCNIVLNGKNYNTPAHGFALNKEFNFLNQTENSISFFITSDESTKEIYPFDFKYVMTYKIEEEKLTIIHEVENPTDDDIYFATGGHETFAFKNKLQNYGVEFEVEEQPIWYKEKGIYVSPAKKPYKLKEGKWLRFPHRYISGEPSLIFGNIKSNKLWFKNVKGQVLAEVGFDGFDNVLFWRSRKAKMICIEPWTNLPDGYVDMTEVSSKYGFRKVEPKKSLKIERYIKYYNEI